MSEAIAFDTHRFVKNFTGHGFTEEQAEVLATEHVALLNSNLATKADIENLRAATKADIAGVKAESLKWMFGAMAAQTGILVAVIRLL